MPMYGLREALHRLNPLAEEAWLALASLGSVRAARAGEHLLRAGERAHRVFYVGSGLIREYYIDTAGHEATRRFCGAGDFSGSLSDLLGGGPAAVFIQALDDCDLVEMDWASVDALSERHPSLMKLMRRLAEALYVRKMRREFEMLTLPASERYRQFAQQEPALVEWLPRHMVASYLGITAVHLSRIAVHQKSRRVPTGQKRRT